MSTAAAVRFVAYAPGEDVPLGFLPAPISWDVSVFHNNVSALTLKYSNLAAGGEYVSRALVTGLDIGFEVNWDDGTGWHEPFDCRFLRVKNNKNDVADPAKLVNLTCPGYGWMLAKVKNMVSGNRKLKNKDTGDIIRLFWNEYTARHGVARTLPIDMSSWTTGTDSAGAAWLKKKTLTFELAADLLTILQGQVDIDHCDYRFDGRQLKLWNPDSQWVDLAGSVRLRLGKEVGEAPADESLEEMIHYLLVRGEKKTKAVLTNTDNTPWGVWEGCINEGGIDSNAEARDAAQKQMDLSSRMRGEYTVTLNLQPGDPLPFKDYRPGDWVSGPDMDGNLQRMRVQQITLSGDGSQVTGSIVLNDLVKASELALASKLASISNGASQTGGTGMAPDVAIDLRQAAAPTGFTVTPSLYLTTAKRWATRLLFEWDAVTTATDGTDLDISSYRVWGISSEETTARVIATVPGTDLSALVDGFGEGTSWSFAVQAVGVTTTEPGAMSTFVSITLPEDTDPPVKTSAPHLESASSIVTASWDGLSATGSAMDPDLSVVRVLADTVNPPTTVVGVLGAEGTWTGYAPAGTTVYFALQAVDTSGNEGAVSDVVSIVVKSVLDDAGLAQLLALNATIYVQDEEPVDPPAESWWWTKTADPTVLRYTADGATWEVMATDGSDFIATPVVVAGVLNAQWIRADNIASDSILARHILAGEITADKVAAGLMTALIVSGDVLRTAESGRRVVIDSTGVSLYDANDNRVSWLNTTGESTFDGVVNASGLTVSGQALFLTESKLAPGAKLFLDAGVQGPASAATISSYWPTMQLKQPGAQVVLPYAVCAYSGTSYPAARWVALNSAYDPELETSVTVLELYSDTGDYITRVTIPGLEDLYLLTWSATMAMKDDKVYFVSQKRTDGTSYGSNKLGVWRGTLTPGAFAFDTVSPALAGTWNTGTDPISLYFRDNLLGIAYRSTSSGTAVFREVDLSTWAVTTLSTTTNPPTGGITSAYWNATDAVYVVTTSNVNQSYVYDAAGVRQQTHEVMKPSGSVLSGGMQSGTHWMADSSGKIYTIDGILWEGNLTTKSIDAQYTFYNSAGPYESKPSPKATATIGRGARVRISVAGWAATAEIPQIRFYTNVTGSPLYAAGVGTGGAPYVEILALPSSGTVPPAATTFPAATPSEISNRSGSLSISADGSIKAASLTVPVVGVRVYSNATPAIPTGNSRLTAWTEEFDTHDIHNNGFFTIPFAGLWEISCNVTWTNTNARRFIQIEKGTGAAGTGSILLRSEGQNTSYLSSVLTGKMVLAANDVISMTLYSSVAVSLHGDWVPTSIALTYEGPITT